MLEMTRVSRHAKVDECAATQVTPRGTSTVTHVDHPSTVAALATTLVVTQQTQITTLVVALIMTQTFDHPAYGGKNHIAWGPSASYII